MSVELPQGWTEVRLGDVVPRPRAKVAPTDHPDLPFIGMDHIAANGMALLGSVPFGNMKSSGSLFFEGDVLYGRMRPYLNKVHSAKSTGACSAEFIVLPASEALESDFLAYLLHQRKFVNFASSKSSGDRPRVDFEELSSFAFALPPRLEQSRIVSKLEELFSCIDEGERALERVQQLVERYRQSVLKAAVAGELTREWRERNAGKFETGEMLLARILEARRTAWEEAELDKMEVKGMKPANDKWKDKYKEPVAPDATDLPELPEGWAWASLDQLCSLITSGSRGWSEYYAASGSLFIRAQNIKRDVLDLNDIAFVDLAGVTDGVRTRVVHHDILVTITGANVAKTALVTSELENAFVSQHVALVRPVMPILSRFLFSWIVSPANGRATLLAAAYGAGKPGLSLEDLKELAVPLPPIAEQTAVCELLDIESSRIDSIAKDADSREKTVLRLRQAVLNRAFRGELVLQDPTDEAAPILLERIAAQRAGVPASRRRHSRKASV